MTAIILAGGRSGRIGSDKAFLRLGEEVLIERQLRLLGKLFRELLVVTNSPNRFAHLNGIRIASDIIPAGGPLGGIFSGLRISRDLHNFIIACDMPFIDRGLVEYMMRKARGFDVVVPKIDKMYEPLFCIYSRNCLMHIEGLLRRNVFKITEFFPAVRVREITKCEVSRFVPPEEAFMNLNSRRDLAGARRLVAEREHAERENLQAGA